MQEPTKSQTPPKKSNSSPLIKKTALDNIDERIDQAEDVENQLTLWAPHSKNYTSFEKTTSILCP